MYAYLRRVDRNVTQFLADIKAAEFSALKDNNIQDMSELLEVRLIR